MLPLPKVDEVVDPELPVAVPVLLLGDDMLEPVVELPRVALLRSLLDEPLVVERVVSDVEDPAELD